MRSIPRIAFLCLVALAAAIVLQFAHGNRAADATPQAAAAYEPAAGSIQFSSIGTGPANPPQAGPIDELLATCSSSRSAPGGQVRFMEDGAPYEWWHPADLTRDGVLDLHDVVEFRIRWQQGGKYGDFNRDGLVDIRDLHAYVDSFHHEEWRRYIIAC
jgi:hypothetical protein